MRVEDIIVEKLIKKVEGTNKVPWRKDYLSVCRNYITQKEYRGINRFLLDGGEYITPHQIQEYNNKHHTNYWFDKGAEMNFVVFYGTTLKKLTEEEKERYENHTMIPCILNLIQIDSKGEPRLPQWTLRYYYVYNIMDVKDKQGNKLPSTLIKSNIEKQENPERMIEDYCNREGVRIQTKNGIAAYSEIGDCIMIPRPEYFDSMDVYYRTIFHELIHSTGIDKRLARECFKKYSNKQERSREELIAEVGAVILGSKAGLQDKESEVENSLNYAAGWIGWMKDNAKEVVIGMAQAEKAVNYFLTGISKIDVN